MGAVSEQGKCNYCGGLPEKSGNWYKWLCPKCISKENDTNTDVGDICQNCGHHRIAHFVTEANGRCVGCTCSKFQDIKNNLRLIAK